MSPDDARHGQNRGYTAHVMDGEVPCEPCRRAHSRAWKTYSIRKYRGEIMSVSTIGATRRIRALSRLGWTQNQIAAACGLKDGRNLRDVLERPTCYTSTHERIKAGYERLSMRLPPSGRSSTRARNIAIRNGWPPPLAWNEGEIDDPDAKPAATHEPGRQGVSAGRLAGEELIAEFEFLRRCGESLEQAAKQLGVTVSAIEKAVERAGKRAA